MKPLKVLDDSGQFAFLSDFVKEEISSSSTQHFYSALMGLPTVRVHSYERGREVVLCDEVVLLFKECVEIFNDIVSRFDKKLKNFRSIDRFLDTTSSFFYRDKKIGLEQLIVFCNNLRDPKVKDILSSFEGIISQMDMGVIFGGVEESFEDITTRFLGVLDTINIYFKGDKKKISTYEIWSFLRQFVIPGEIGYFQRDNEVTNHLFLDDYRKKQGINISNIIVARFGGKKEYYRRFLEDCARLFIMKTEIENLISSTENPEVCAAFSKFLKK
jgi:hypothetical protein